MERLRMRIDPDATDPGHWGHSLVNLAELLIGSLDAAEARSVVEVGAYAGDLTGLLLEWAARTDATVTAVDPLPQAELETLARRRPDLELVRAPSLEALAQLELPDVVVLDGDHNYFTVSGELRVIAERAPGAAMPPLLFHDVAWPHARRDAYYDPDAIPPEHRQPLHEGGGLFPGDPGIRPGALPYKWPAEREGGPANGVLTAIEDFVSSHPGLRLVVAPAFFGFGAVWHADHPAAARLEDLLGSWDRHPLLDRLEENRVHHLAVSHVGAMENARAAERIAAKEDLLGRLLASKAVGVALAVSRLYRRGEPAFRREQLEHALRR